MNKIVLRCWVEAPEDSCRRVAFCLCGTWPDGDVREEETHYVYLDDAFTPNGFHPCFNVFGRGHVRQFGVLAFGVIWHGPEWKHGDSVVEIPAALVARIKKLSVSHDAPFVIDFQ